MTVTGTDDPARFQSGVRRTGSSVLAPEVRRPDPGALGLVVPATGTAGGPGRSRQPLSGWGAAALGRVCGFPGRRAPLGPMLVPPHLRGQKAVTPSPLSGQAPLDTVCPASLRYCTGTRALRNRQRRQECREHGSLAV